MHKRGGRGGLEAGERGDEEEHVEAMQGVPGQSVFWGKKDCGEILCGLTSSTLFLGPRVHSTVHICQKGVHRDAKSFCDTLTGVGNKGGDRSTQPASPLPYTALVLQGPPFFFASPKK